MWKPFHVTKVMRSDDPIVAAQAYIHAGLKIVVLHGISEKGVCTCHKKKNCTSPGKHPITKFFPKGVHSATAELDLVKKAFKSEPDANLAVALENLTVVDVDGPVGQKAVNELNLPDTPFVRTRRGHHYHFLGELEGGTFKKQELDILTGASRYVLVPPSLHADGQYEWSSSGSTKFAKTPSALNGLRNKEPKPSKKKTGGLIPEGNRNDLLFRTACSLRRRGVAEDVLLKMMQILNEDGCNMPLPSKELRSLVRSSGKYDRETEDLFGPPLVTEPLPMEFLWYPYIPRYGVTIIAGDPGRGKSLLVAMMIAIVTGGKNWPLSKEKPSGKRVLLLSAEDNWARVTLPRLVHAGANVGNIHVMSKFRTLDVERLQLLRQEMLGWRPDVVVIDTLSAYMGGGRDMHRQNEVGEFLATLTELAEETGSAIVGLAHLNKQGGEQPIYRIVGSIGFVASIRSALFLGSDPSDGNRLALAHGKSNAAEPGPTIIFEKVGGGRDQVPILKAVGFSDANAADVCFVEKRPVGNPGGEREAARQFILEYLTDNPIAWISVLTACEARSIASEGTLNSLRADMARDGEIQQIGRGRKAKWRLVSRSETAK